MVRKMGTVFVVAQNEFNFRTLLNSEIVHLTFS